MKFATIWENMFVTCSKHQTASQIQAIAAFPYPAMESILVASNLQGDRVTCLNFWWVLATTFTILELAYDLHMPTAQMTYTLEDLKQKWKVTPPKKNKGF